MPRVLPIHLHDIARLGRHAHRENALIEGLDGPLQSFLLADKFHASLGDAARGEGEATFAGPCELRLALLEQADHRRMQKEPRIAALHPADHARIGLLVSDIIGPRRQADRNGVRTGRNGPAQVVRLREGSIEILQHNFSLPSARDATICPVA